MLSDLVKIDTKIMIGSYLELAMDIYDVVRSASLMMEWLTRALPGGRF